MSSSGPDSGNADPLRPRYEENCARMNEYLIYLFIVVFLYSMYLVVPVAIVRFWFHFKNTQVQTIIKRNLLVSPSTVVQVHHQRLQEHLLFQEIHRHEAPSIRGRRDLGQHMHKVHQAIHLMLLDLRSSQNSVRSSPSGKSLEIFYWFYFLLYLCIQHIYLVVLVVIFNARGN